MAKTQGLCIAIVFVDVVSAFASMCRVLLFDLPECQADLVQKLAALSFTPEEIQAVVEVVCSDIWASNNASAHLSELLRMMHANMWFSVEGVKRIA